METFWFVAVALMLAVYIVLDGFDFGTGIIYMFVAQTDEERRLDTSCHWARVEWKRGVVDRGRRLIVFRLSQSLCIRV